MSDGIFGVLDNIGVQVSNAIWDTMIKWFYETVYSAAADFFTMMGNMGADIFELDWVKAKALNELTQRGYEFVTVSELFGGTEKIPLGSQQKDAK